ncbi:PIG-L deacetylase family protein [Sphingomonas oryzagri]
MIASRLSSSVWHNARWLVIAPHPDDETLGAGALIAETARDRRLGGIVYLTDGTGSHPPDTRRLAVARRREAGHALRRLGGVGLAIYYLGWQDAHPHPTGSPAYLRDVLRLAAWARARRIDAIAVTDRDEHHCDHVAAYHLARAAISAARRPMALFSYHVWGDPPGEHVQRFRTSAVLPGRRRHALRAHRSQLSPLFGDGFRLDVTKQRMPATDTLSLRRALP